MKQFALLVFLICDTFILSAQTNAYFIKALEYKKTDNYTEVIKNLKLAVAQEPSNVLYKETLADALFTKKIYHEAIREYIDLGRLGGDNNFYKLRLAEAFTASNKFADAIETGKQIEIDRLDRMNKSKYYNAMGSSYFKVNYFPAALEAFTQMLAIGEGNIEDVNLKIARCHSELNSFDKAAPYFEKSISGAAVDAKRVLEVGMNYYNGGRLTQAIDKYLQAANLGTKQDLGFNFNLANMYFEAKNYKTALQYLDKAKAQSPYDQDVASLIAYCHYYAGNTKTAREVIQEMLAVNPEDGDAIYLMGLTYQKDGKMDKAENYFEKSFKVKPSLEKLRVSMMKL